MEPFAVLGALLLLLGLAVVVRAGQTPRPAVMRVVGVLAAALGFMLIVLPLVRAP